MRWAARCRGPKPPRPANAAAGDPRRRRRFGGGEDHHHARPRADPGRGPRDARVHRRLPPLRPQAARRARHHPAPPRLQLHRHRRPGPGPPAGGRGDPEARLPSRRRDLRSPRVTSSRTSSPSSRGCWATTPRRCASATTCASTWRPRRSCGASGRCNGTALGAATRPTRCSASWTGASRTRRPSSARRNATPTWWSRSRPATAAIPTSWTPWSCCATASPTPTCPRSSGTGPAPSPWSSAVRSSTCTSRAASTRGAPPRSRRRSGRSSTSPPTCAASDWASSPSGSTCTARNRSRSSSC